MVLPFLFFVLCLVWLLDTLALALLFPLVSGSSQQPKAHAPLTIHDYLAYLSTRPDEEIADFFLAQALDMYQRGESLYRIRATLELFEEYLHEIAQENTQQRDAA